MVFYFRKAKKDTLQRTPAVPLKQEMLFSIYRSDFFPYVRSSGWPNFLDMSSCILGPHFNLSTHTMRKHLATILVGLTRVRKSFFFCILSSPKMTTNHCTALLPTPSSNTNSSPKCNEAPAIFGSPLTSDIILEELGWVNEEKPVLYQNGPVMYW